MKYIFLFIFTSLQLFSFDIDSIKSFQADFTQTIKNPSGKILDYNGTLYIENNNVLWKYTQPIIKNVYLKQGFVIIDEPELEQAIYTQIEKEINLFDLMKKAKEVKRDHYIAILKDIEYNVLVNNDKIQSVFYTDNLENQVNIEFENVKNNLAIDPNLFIFNAPKGYDIIRK